MAETTRFSRADYMLLPEGYPAELIDGQFVKDPSPSPWHQAVVMEIYTIARRAAGRERVLAAPIDAFFDDHNILQPDLVVLPAGACVTPDLTEIPTPDLVVEVLSPSTADRDRRIKSRIYLEAGVREVWIVDPEARTVEVRTPGRTETAQVGGQASSAIVAGLTVDVRALLSP